MVKHGALSRSHVRDMLGSKDARVRRAAFTLLEASNPTLFVPYKVHELIGARLKIEKRQQLAAADRRTEAAHESGFFKRLFRRRAISSGPIRSYSGSPSRPH